MKRALYWLVDHWRLPLLIGGIVLLWILTGGRKAPPADTIKRELAAIRAGVKAREMQLLVGKQQAADKLRQEHAEALAQLKDKHIAKAEELRNDPVALSRFLVRVGRPDPDT